MSGNFDEVSVLWAMGENINEVSVHVGDEMSVFVGHGRLCSARTGVFAHGRGNGLGVEGGRVLG